MAINPRITLTKTEGEWKEIEVKLKEMNKKNVCRYVRFEVKQIVKKYIEDSKNITQAAGEKKEKQIPISSHTYMILMELSHQMQRPVNSIVDDFLIVPLLNPKP